MRSDFLRWSAQKISEQDATGACPSWTIEEGKLERAFAFENFESGLAFVNTIAALCNAANHHPDVLLKYKSVTFSLITHDQQSLTQADVEMAQRIDTRFDRL